MTTILQRKPQKLYSNKRQEPIQLYQPFSLADVRQQVQIASIQKRKIAAVRIPELSKEDTTKKQKNVISK